MHDTYLTFLFRTAITLTHDIFKLYIYKLIHINIKLVCNSLFVNNKYVYTTRPFTVSNLPLLIRFSGDIPNIREESERPPRQRSGAVSPETSPQRHIRQVSLNSLL